jgi:hypothetical protein
MNAERISEFDVVIRKASENYIKALRKAGLCVWKVGSMTYQVSFDGFAEYRNLLPAIGMTWMIGDGR